MIKTRIRLPEDQAIGSLTPLELLDLYLHTGRSSDEEVASLIKLAGEIIEENHKEAESGASPR
jgi:hypothetical protein